MNNEELKENMSDRLRRSKQSFDEMRAETQAKARRAMRVTDNYAHDHPWQTVAAAAGMAFVIGLLLRKSPRKVIVRKSKDAPVLKVREVRPKGSAWEAVAAFMPTALFAAKTMMAARAKHNNTTAQSDTASLP